MFKSVLNMTLILKYIYLWTLNVPANTYLLKQ